jgi:hypothetical protein
VATRKQRRRRAKEQRHEYEVVYLDDEGNEVEVDTDEAEQPKAKSQKSAPKRGAETRARGRSVDPPSWRRTFRRGLIFAPIFFATVLLIMPDRDMAGAIAQTLLLLVIFVPFSYFMDRVFWRSYQKRVARSGGGS